MVMLVVLVRTADPTWLDGQPLSASDKEVSIALIEDGGRHEVRVELG